MNNTEFYDRLGVSKNASQDEIKKTIGNYHSTRKIAEEKVQEEVQEAYETLVTSKRAAHDAIWDCGCQWVASVAEQVVLVALMVLALGWHEDI